MIQQRFVRPLDKWFPFPPRGRAVCALCHLEIRPENVALLREMLEPAEVKLPQGRQP